MQIMNNSRKIRYSYLIISFLLLGAFKSALAAIITYDGPAGKLIMDIRYHPLRRNYLNKFRLVDENNKVLNKGQFKGCTYGGNITDIADYLKNEMKLINVTPIKYGFAIHYVTGCGGQNSWQLNVITPACIASVPATDDNGKYINIGDDPHQILFGLLKGFGASRQVEKKYLTIDGNIIKYNIRQFLKNNYKPKIICR